MPEINNNPVKNSLINELKLALSESKEQLQSKEEELKTYQQQIDHYKDELQQYTFNAMKKQAIEQCILLWIALLYSK